MGARQDIPNECRSYDSVKMILNRREAVRGAAAVAFEVRKDHTTCIIVDFHILQDSILKLYILFRE